MPRDRRPRRWRRPLAGRWNLAAVHVIAHGAPGRVGFAAGEWSHETLARDAGDLAAIGRALAENGDLRCGAATPAAARAGRRLSRRLSEATGAYVAAATARIGAAALGGRWEIVAVGLLPEPPLTGAGRESYSGLLADFDLTLTGTIGTGGAPATNTFYVVDTTGTARIVSSFQLPNKATGAAPTNFSVIVTVPSSTDNYTIYDSSFNVVGTISGWRLYSCSPH